MKGCYPALAKRRANPPIHFTKRFQMPDDDAFTDYGKLTTATKKKILGLNAARLYDIPVPAGLELPDTTAGEDMQPGEELVQDTAGAGAQA